MKTSRFQQISRILLASTVMCGATAALAQEAGFDEIVVTAQKREENLQKVPISIQALGTQKLEQLNVSDFNDYTKMLPSVSFQSSQPGVTTVYFRGVASGGDGNHSGSLPSVGVYLDEQPVTTIGGTLDVHIYDIARIEALSGPQGTLYGASSEAGTLRIITNKPDTSGFAGALDAQVNSVKNGGIGHLFEGFINAPLSDRAAVRVVGFYQHDAGYIDNVAGSRSFIPLTEGEPGLSTDNAAFVKKNYNDADIAGGRAALKVDLDDDWTVTTTVTGQDRKNHGSFGYDPSVGDLKVQHFGEEGYHDRFVQAALTIEGKIGNWDMTYAGAYMKRKVDSIGDYTDYSEAYDSIYADYGGLAYWFYFQDDNGDLVLPVQKIIGNDKFNKLSQEFRISSPQDAPLRLVAGAFYQRQFHAILQDYQVDGLGSAMSVNGRPGTLWLTKQDRIDKDYALFGELSYDIAPTVTVTGGLRVFKYDNSLIGFFGFGRNADGPPWNGAGSSRTGVAGCYTSSGLTVRDDYNNGTESTVLAPVIDGTPCTNLGVPNADGTVSPKRAKGDGMIHRLNLTWKPSDDQMVYATWSRGFRPGGINRRSTIAPYAPDYLTNFEVGFKTSWLDRRLRINGAVFMQDWKDFQFSFLGANSFTEIHNGPDARIKGVELDASLRVSDGFTLSGSAAYTDAKIRKNLCGADDETNACTGEDNFVSASKGTRLPVTPKFKASGTARYEYELAGGKAYTQAVVSHSGSASSDLRTLIFSPIGEAVNPAELQGRLKAYTTVDFAFGIDWDRYSLGIFLENAFDERAQLSRFQQCGQCFQRPYVVTNTPQTMGIKAGYKF